MNSLKYLIKKKFGTYRSAAKEIGISPSHLSNLLCGWRSPEPLDIERLSDLLQINQEEVRCYFEGEKDE